MQVDVTRTMASRLLRIFGSGTFSTCTLYGAHQVNAFISVSFPTNAGISSKELAEQRLPLRLVLSLALTRARAARLALNREDVAGFHQAFEVPQVFANDAFG